MVAIAVDAEIPGGLRIVSVIDTRTKITRAVVATAAVALVAIGFATGSGWLAMIAVLVVLVYIAFSR